MKTSSDVVVISIIKRSAVSGSCSLDVKDIIGPQECSDYALLPTFPSTFWTNTLSFLFFAMTHHWLSEFVTKY